MVCNSMYYVNGEGRIVIIIFYPSKFYPPCITTSRGGFCLLFRWWQTQWKCWWCCDNNTKRSVSDTIIGREGSKWYNNNTKILTINYAVGASEECRTEVIQDHIKMSKQESVQGMTLMQGYEYKNVMIVWGMSIHTSLMLMLKR